MNDRQKKATDIFLCTGDGKGALIEAGYSEKFAKRYESFFEKEEMQSYIKERISPVVVEADSPSDEIIEYLKKVMRGEEDTNPTQRMKAAEILCRHYGLNKENKDDASDEDIQRPVVIYEDIRE